MTQSSLGVGLTHLIECHYIAEILLKVELNINQSINQSHLIGIARISRCKTNYSYVIMFFSDLQQVGGFLHGL